MVRAMAHNVPFNVATGAGPSPVRYLMPSRRDWKVPQFDVEVSSRYFPCDGNHASQSNLRAALDPRSPVAMSTTW